MNLRTLAVLAVTALACAPRASASAAEVATDASTSEPTYRWYGWQVLACDAASVSLIYVGRREEWLAPQIVGIGGYLGAAGYVHNANGHSKRGYLSAGLRLGVPLLGLALTNRDAWFVGLGVSTMLVDALALSWRRVEPTRSSFPSVTPTATWIRQGALLGLQGTF